MKIRNFLFHRVNEERDNFWPAILPKEFDKIVGFITKKYHVVAMEILMENLHEFSRSKKPIATIMFDDGYKDNIEYAAPILQNWSCPASFYVVTDCIERNFPTWTFILDYILQRSSQPKILLDFHYVPYELKIISLDKNSEAQQKRLKPFLKSLSNKERLIIMKAIVDQCRDIDLSMRIMMNWADLSSLLSQGFIVGSHSHTHPMLGKLEDIADIKEELELSKHLIRQRLNTNAETISYPIGSYDDRVIKCSREAGYKFGLAVEQKFYNYDRNNLFAIPRVELYHEPFWKTNLRINGVTQLIKQVMK